MIPLISQYWSLLLQGLGTTLKLLGLAILFGIPFGVLLGVSAARYHVSIRYILNWLVLLIKSIPFLVFLFWLHYPLQAVLAVVIPPFYTATVALILVNTVLTASTIFRAFEQIPKVHQEAGKTLGLKRRDIVRYIELPVVLRKSAPQLLVNQASMLEYTLLASFISVQELFRTVQTINAMVYKPVELYTLLVFFFILILLPINLVVAHIQKRYKYIYDPV